MGKRKKAAPTEPWDDPREELLSVMPPPKKPAMLLPHNWDALEDEIGFELPSDYKWYIDTYGSGAAWNYLYVAYPFHKWHCARERGNVQRYKDVLLGWSEMIVSLAKDDLARVDLPLYPDEGLLWFAEGDDLTNFFLLRNSDDPNRWPVYAYGVLNEEEDYNEVQRCESDGFLRFITDLMGLRSSLFPEIIRPLFFEDPGKFVPVSVTMTKAELE